MKSDVLVIGCSGFLGINFCNYLIQHTQYQVAGIDEITDLGMKSMQAVIHSKSRFSFYPIEISGKNNYLYDGSIYLKSVFGQILPRFVVIDLEALKDLKAAQLENVLYSLADVGVEKVILLADQDNPLGAQLDFSDFALTNPSCSLYCLNVPNVFGARARAKNAFFKACKSAIVAAETGVGPTVPFSNAPAKSWIYIKDLYFSIISVLSDGIVKTGNWDMGTHNGVSEEGMYDFLLGLCHGIQGKLMQVPLPSPDLYAISSFDLGMAAEHTLTWYYTNRWAWDE